MIALVPTQLDPFQNIGKYNPNIILTKEDKKSKLKIYCHEPYAQELYDLMSGRNGGTTSKMESKDLILNEVYKVRATHLLKADRSILTEEVNSGVSIIVPIKEYSKSIDELAAGKNNEFYVKLYHSAKDGEYIGSEKKDIKNCDDYEKLVIKKKGYETAATPNFKEKRFFCTKCKDGFKPVTNTSSIEGVNDDWMEQNAYEHVSECLKDESYCKNEEKKRLGCEIVGIGKLNKNERYCESYCVIV
jgi:hypothetical protein